MPGLDPGIHAVSPPARIDANGMDCRVKPGNDDTPNTITHSTRGKVGG